MQTESALEVQVRIPGRCMGMEQGPAQVGKRRGMRVLTGQQEAFSTRILLLLAQCCPFNPFSPPNLQKIKDEQLQFFPHTCFSVDLERGRTG